MFRERARKFRKVLFTRHPWAHVLLSALVVAVFLISGRLDPPDWLFSTGLVLHLLGLVLSLGAVIVIDWNGLAWIAGLRSMRETLRTAQSARPLVWIGLSALLVSGLFLHPDLSTPMPWLKMVAVLLVVNNGLVVTHVERRMGELPRQVQHHQVSPGLWWRIRGSIVASHVGWWVAVAIGVATMLQRR